MSVNVIQFKASPSSLGSQFNEATFDAPTTAGSTIAVVISSTGANVDAEIIDDQDNVYTMLPKSSRVPTAHYASIFSQIGYVKHATAGTELVQVTLGGNSHYVIGIYELEESEVRAAQIIGNGTGGATDPTLGPITPISDNSTTIAVYALDNNAGSTPSAAAGTGWTADVNIGGGFAGYFSEHRTLTTAAAITADGVFVVFGGTLEWAGSLAAFNVRPAIPINTVPSVIAGQASVGKTLTATPGTWTDEVSRTANWQRSLTTNGTYANIGGATSTTYVIQAGDLGYYLRYMESSSNAESVTYGPETEPSNVLGSVGTSVGDLAFLFEMQTDMSIEIPTGEAVPGIAYDDSSAAPFILLIA